jgi:hypothetical protein
LNTLLLIKNPTNVLLAPLSGVILLDWPLTLQDIPDRLPGDSLILIAIINILLNTILTLNKRVVNTLNEILIKS